MLSETAYGTTRLAEGNTAQRISAAVISCISVAGSLLGQMLCLRPASSPPVHPVNFITASRDEEEEEEEEEGSTYQHNAQILGCIETVQCEV